MLETLARGARSNAGPPLSLAAAQASSWGVAYLISGNGTTAGIAALISTWAAILIIGMLSRE